MSLLDNILEQDEAPKKIEFRHGITFYIEWPAGSIRQYRNSNYQRLMKADYGYVPGAYSEHDGDSIDVYLGTFHNETVYVVSQLKVNAEFKDVEDKPERVFDEFKYFIDFKSAQEVEKIYTDTLSPNHFGGIHEIGIQEFKEIIQKAKMINQTKKEKTMENARDYGSVLAGLGSALSIPIPVINEFSKMDLQVVTLLKNNFYSTVNKVFKKYDVRPLTATQKGSSVTYPVAITINDLDTIYIFLGLDPVREVYSLNYNDNGASKREFINDYNKFSIAVDKFTAGFTKVALV